MVSPLKKAKVSLYNDKKVKNVAPAITLVDLEEQEPQQQKVIFHCKFCFQKL